MTAKIIDAEKSAVITVDSLGQWLTLVYCEGYSSKNSTVLVDGSDVSAAMSDVAEDGSVAKLPLTGMPGTLEVKSGDAVQTLTISSTPATDAVYTGSGYLPYYILAHGPVAAWDYYLTNYDKDGNVRISPVKTVFALHESKSENPSYSPNAEISEGDTFGAVKGEVTILFNYNTEDEKAWFDGIAQSGALGLVSYNENKNTLNANLSYTIETNVQHGAGLVGELTIPVDQTNFRNNGRYYIRVTSAAGATELVPIHVLNALAPELLLKESAISGKNLHMQVNNMSYAITVPIERVMLTDPAGETMALTMIDDWYLFGDLFVLYNDLVNHLPYNGVYTITIEAAGFKSVSKQFAVTDGAAVPAAMSYVGIDAFSSATSGGSTGSDSSGGVSISADILFTADLLVNARILERLGMETAASAAVVDYWYGMIPDSVFDKGSTDYYDWTDYIDAVETAKVGGTILSFVAYQANGSKTLNRPYAVKEVLEDGLLGDIQYSSSYGRDDAPQFTVGSAAEGADVVLTCTESSYLSKISAIYLNDNWQAMNDELYEINAEASTLTIKAAALSVGAVRLAIDASGYRRNIVTFTYAKVTEEGLALSVSRPVTEGEDVVITVVNSDGDFLKNLKSVTLYDAENAPDTVWAAGVEGSNAVCYVLSSDFKSITLKNVPADSYTISISAEYYDAALTAGFMVNEKEVDPNPGTEPATAPDVSGFEKVTPFFDDAYNRVTFSGMDAAELSAYLKAITSVTVGENTYTRKSGSFWNDSNKFRTYVISDTYGTSVHDCLQLTLNGFSAAENTTVTITSEGYLERTFTVSPAGELITDGAETGAALLDLEHSGIVNVSGVNYAVLVFTDDAINPAEYTYSLSGQDWFAPTAVNTAGTIFKMQLPDATARTLALCKNGAPVEIITLGAIGSSSLAAAEVADAVLAKNNREPHIVLTKEEIPLTQYLMFIESGAPGYQTDGLWIYPTTTTVNASLAATQKYSIDAVSSATEQGEIEFDGVTKEATIAVLFDMIANHTIADTLGIAPDTTDALLEKWEELEKGIALDADATYYGAAVGDVIDTAVTDDITPKYVKYLTASGTYGTKVYFDTTMPDSRTAPQISIADIEIYNDITVSLSEENETWFLYLTEISIPYTSAKDYHYLADAVLSADGLSLTLPRCYVGGMYAGPTEYTDSYTATFRAVGFDAVSADFSVRNASSSLTINQTWDDENQQLVLDTKHDSSSYFPFDFEALYINDIDCTDSVTTSGYLPWEGSVSATEIMDAPTLTIVGESVIANSTEVTFAVDNLEWLAEIAKENVSLVSVSSYGWEYNESIASVTADMEAGTLTITVPSNSAFSASYTYRVTLSCDGYKDAQCSFKPVK